MALDPEQKGILSRSGAAILVSAVALGAAYVWIPAGLFGLNDDMNAGDRIAFALKVDLPVFLWLAGCLRAVSGGRYRTPADRKGAAYGKPTPALAIMIAVLQNSLEQTVLALGAHLILATVLRGQELVLIPVMVLLYMVGRFAFAINYSKGAVARAFGMALTGAPIVIGYLLAAALLVAGR